MNNMNDQNASYLRGQADLGRAPVDGRSSKISCRLTTPLFSPRRTFISYFYKFDLVGCALQSPKLDGSSKGIQESAAFGPVFSEQLVFNPNQRSNATQGRPRGFLHPGIGSNTLTPSHLVFSFAVSPQLGVQQPLLDNQ